MAYFPNGTAGELFESRECQGCIHHPADDDEKGFCMVWMIHQLSNYEQIVDGKRDNPLAKMMMLLIDDEEQPLGKMCSMRIQEQQPTRDPTTSPKVVCGECRKVCMILDDGICVECRRSILWPGA